MKIKKTITFFIMLIICSSCNMSNESSKSIEKIARGAKIAALSKAPSFSLKNLKGEVKSLQDFKGKVVLLNFWATWCAPCVAEMPALQAVYDSFKDKGLEVVTISCDAPEALADLRKFVTDKKLTLNVLSDGEIEVPTIFGVTGFPESFFIGRDGEFLEFEDPATGDKAVRIVADRPWDAPEFKAEIKKLL